MYHLTGTQTEGTILLKKRWPTEETWLLMRKKRQVFPNITWINYFLCLILRTLEGSAEFRNFV